MTKPSLKVKSLVSLSTAAVFLFSSIAPAAEQVLQNASGAYVQKQEKLNIPGTLTESEKDRLAQDKALLEKMGYQVQVDKAAKKAIVYEPGSKKPVMEFPFADEGTLRKFSPKSLNAMLMEEMRKVNTANKEAFSHSLKNLPTESAIFFMAMGAVVAGQLITNYSQNPLAMQQHVEHSMSPLGVFGFYTFMYSQGVTSNVLAMYLKNPKFHHMIPYLGMSVGMFAQSYLSEIAMDPNVKACAKTMMGGKVTEKDQQAGVDADPCSKAYNYLVINKKLWEYAPGLVSMLASSALAGVGQSVVTKAVLRVTGVDIATFLIPGGMQVKGIRLLLVKGLQIAAFVAIDQWLNRQVTYAWKNVFDGRELGTIGTDIENNVNALKANQWKGDDKELQASMKLFRDKMSAWRMMNLSEVYEAHQNWQTALTQLTGMYNSSYAFYNDFVEQVRGERFANPVMKPLQSDSPLYGVNAKNVTEDRKDLYLTKSLWVENMQILTIKELAPKALEMLSAADFKYLYPKEKEKFTQLVQGLQSEDRTALGLTLKDLNNEVQVSSQNVAASRQYFQMVWALRGLYGNPNPMMEKGRGWVNAYADTPTSSEKVKSASYYRQVGIFMTPKVTDYFIMQMICGPDVENGEKAIKNSVGYPSVFMPPTIRNENDEFDPCFGIKADARAERIYNWPVKSVGGNYDGFVTYLFNQIRPSALGTAQESGFEIWWKKNTESQMQATFASFGTSYQEIVIKMIKGIYRPGRSHINAGPVYNGTMNSVFQEERVYLSMLAELLAPTQKYTMNLENNMSVAPTQALLKDVETQFSIMNGLIRKIKVVTKDGREQIESPIENYQLEEQLQNVQAALAKVSAAVGVGEEVNPALQVTAAQRNMAVTALESLQGLASEIMMYGSMANAVSWDKIRNLKQVNMEQNKYNNEIQKKLAQLRGMTMPSQH